ncbi:MAG: alpha/beta hydrolase [Oscillatoriales cyanobacterium]|uniref:Alpha/beta hydrolase n=1 Tax=Microcoleus anatoxicus PTRS2 TaxID=2705321 RepID=A0ABU8YME9_9CYAN|nr:MAG: alpha/beta hydrolase [Oscillatoriales cyanobacterium]TAD94790.1 MAG: alpha/beta hydrolase [Oscillatoriales cyanobacterium]TAE02399.1 MAG: alpha/beta hydrolase [Oscillatoriales cyanobacterium]TAF03903.1 MAG: alpha/beta hydrolase [Oscillatoriales cyanobacterium]TAF37868.1 MAG: alpha/beta hydrolase [Oscillatoriales cyanobacterium]
MNFQFQSGYLDAMGRQSAHFTNKISKSLSLGLALLLGTSAVLLSSGKALALETVTVKYGAIDVTLPLADLQSFTQTGKPSPQLQSVLSLAKQTPESVREILTREVALDSQLVTRLANSYFGEIVLKQLGEVAYAPATRAQSAPALRDALVGASKDGKISLIEVMQNYTPSALEVDGNQAMAVYQRVMKDMQDLQAMYKNSPAMQGTAGQALNSARQMICQPNSSGNMK